MPVPVELDDYEIKLILKILDSEAVGISRRENRERVGALEKKLDLALVQTESLVKPPDEKPTGKPKRGHP